jgi:streptogramin lyase
MAVDDVLEARLTEALRDRLDASSGPHPRWADAPVARRVEGWSGAPIPKVGSRASGPRLLPWVAAAAVAVVAVGAAFVASQPGPGITGAATPGPSASPSAMPVRTVQPQPGLIDGPFSYGGPRGVMPPIVAASDGSIWLRDGAGNAIRFDPTTNEQTRLVPMLDRGHGTGGLAASPGSIWATGEENGEVIIRRLDPTTGAVLLTNPYHLGDAAAEQIAAAADEVWVHRDGSSDITRLDHDGAGATVDFGTSAYRADAIDQLLGTGRGSADAAFWADLPELDRLVRIPMAAPKLAVTVNGCGGVRFVADETAIWTICGTDLVRLDQVTGARQASVPLPEGLGAQPHAIAVGGGWIWLAVGARILQVDPATGGAIARFDLADRGWPVFAGGKLVVADESGSVSVITPMKP